MIWKIERNLRPQSFSIFHRISPPKLCPGFATGLPTSCQNNEAIETVLSRWKIKIKRNQCSTHHKVQLIPKRLILYFVLQVVSSSDSISYESLNVLVLSPGLGQDFQFGEAERSQLGQCNWSFTRFISIFRVKILKLRCWWDFGGGDTLTQGVWRNHCLKPYG